MTWVGLDLHQRYIKACAMDDAGVIVAAHPYQVKLIWQARDRDALVVKASAQSLSLIRHQREY